MKLLYFGTVCNRDAFEARQAKSRRKASVAPLNFESALLEGFADHGVSAEVYSFPMVASFPGSPLFSWGRREEEIAGGYRCRWLPAVNLKGLKQLSQRLSVRRSLRLIRKRQVDAVLIYSVYAPVAGPVQKACKKYGVPCCCILADLPADMYENRKVSFLKKALSRLYTGKAIRLQSGFDRYVYLTEAMASVVNPDAPYLVVEGIADAVLHDAFSDQPRKKAVMYAGALNEKYGIRSLAEVFLALDLPDWELWIFGQGDLSGYFSDLAQKEPRLRYFGRVDRAKVLQAENEASLLVNPRPVGERYTKYSFPSKTIEYMLSGTPLLMTELEGIPREYFDHVYSAGDGSRAALKAALTGALEDGELLRKQKGLAARAFILSRCTAKRQAGRILEFLSKE